MHEISLIQNLLESVLTEIEAEGRPVETFKGLALTVGAMELHSEESFRQAFAIESKGTVLAGLPLELTVVSPDVECSQCGFDGPLPRDEADPHDPDPIVECPRCGAPAPVRGGRGVQQIQLIVDS